MEKEPWGCSKIIDECQKYSIKKCLLLAGEHTELASHPELITLQIINGNCSVYSDGTATSWSESADVELDESGEPIYLSSTELKAGDVIQLVPNTKFRLQGHSKNDAFMLVTYYKIPPEIKDDLDD